MKETYDVMYSNRCSSAREGWKKTLRCCINYIKKNNGTDVSYFRDYKDGAVSVICNETDKVVYELPIESYDVIFVSEDKKILKKMNWKHSKEYCVNYIKNNNVNGCFEGYKVSVVENIGCAVVYEETIGKNELDYGEDKRNKCNNSIQGI